VLAFLGGEVDARWLEPYRRAGLEAYDLLNEVDDRRAHRQNLDPWAVDRSNKLEAVCAWNGFVHQTLADKLIEGDDQAAPLTAGFVPGAESALKDFVNAAPAGRAVEVGRLKQVLARMLAAAEYAERPWGGEHDPAVCAELAERLRDALAQGYLLGQLLAMPELLRRIDYGWMSASEPIWHGADEAPASDAG
jgi:hypothetical protein